LWFPGVQRAPPHQGDETIRTRGQGRHRFDLPGNALGVLYLAETEEHAVAETIQPHRHADLRWWSAFWGDWHRTVLFRHQILADAITYGAPFHLDVTTPPDMEAARLLDIG
jgi:hypothetical protein